MKGYKVVMPKENGYYFSASSTCSMTYRIGIPTLRVGGNGPLAVFDAITYAESFVEHFEYLVIFECDYEFSFERRLWYMCLGRRITFMNHLIPYGTEFADSVTLIREAS